MSDKTKQYGLIIEEKPEDFILGGGKIPFEVLQPDGNWFYFLPVKEFQSLAGFESFACVPFTILNCVETLIKRKYGIDSDWSDRFLATVVDTRSGGTTYQKACDFLRKIGVPPEEVWAFGKDVDTTEKFFAPISPEVYALAKEFNAEWDLSYERVPSNHQDIAKALTTSPLLFSVAAWSEKDGMYYRPQGMTDNHATTLFYARQGVFYRMFDTYDAPHIKDHNWNDLPMVCLRFHIEKRTQKKKQDRKSVV